MFYTLVVEGFFQDDGSLSAFLKRAFRSSLFLTVPVVCVLHLNVDEVCIARVTERHVTLSFQSLIQSSNDGSKSVHINLSNAFAKSLQEYLQSGSWQGIDIRCSQYEESRSREGSYVPFRPPSRARLQQQRTGEHRYESLPPFA